MYPVATAAVVAGLTARIVFSAMTDRRFEDALITATHARNAASGNGLTHHPGEEATHGFTSAVSVLVPLAAELAHDGAGLLGMRLATLVAFVITIICAGAIGRQLGVSEWLMVFPLAYLAFGFNQIFYGMAGMETQIATAVLLAALWSLMTRRVAVAGVLLGLALLVRPDFILLVLPALIYLFLRRRRDALAAGLITSVVVLPWVVFTTLYYGSPVPNTIRAKSLRYATDFPSLTSPLDWIDFTRSQLSQRAEFLQIWAPLLESGAINRLPVDAALVAFVALVFIGLVITGASKGMPSPGWPIAVTFLVLFALYRVYFLPPDYYRWYMVPFMALAAVAAGRGLVSLGRLLPRVAIAVSCILAVAFSIHMPATFVLERRVQHGIEDRVRKPLGLYLDDVVRPGERVVSESAGYVGYYSDVTLYDYPGLTSPGALSALQTLGHERNSLSELANVVRPEWIVMRPDEWEVLAKDFPETAALYRVDRHFSAVDAAEELEFLGLGYGTWDKAFLVLRRV